MGEGAAMLILETEEHARARGARIYCELAGYGATADAYHITAPDPTGVGAVKAIRIALKDAGFTEENKPDMDRVGTIIGNGIGGMQTTGEAWKTLLERGPDRLSPLAIPELIANEGAGNISMALGAKGPAQVVVTACASSTDALGIALDLMRAGRADVMVAGGTEATILEFAVGGFMKMKALATQFNDRPEKGSRPFNADRCGFVMGEGAAMLILETEEHARARGAHIYCELAGYGATADAYHITAPDPSGVGAVKAIRIALKDAGVEDLTTVDYINAHGTSTHLNDAMEGNNQARDQAGITQLSWQLSSR